MDLSTVAEKIPDGDRSDNFLDDEFTTTRRELYVQWYYHQPTDRGYI